MPLPIDSTLKQISRLTEEQNCQLLASQLGLQYTSLDNYPFNLNALSLLPIEKAKEYGWAVYLRTPTKIRIAITHPESQTSIAQIQALTNTEQLTAELTVVSLTSFNILLKSYEQLLGEKTAEDVAHLEQLSKAKDKDYFSKIQTLEDLTEAIKQVNLTELLDVILAAAYNLGASDIHIEPAESEITIRFRIDGLLKRVLGLQPNLQKQIISRIKMMANLKLDEQNSIQDGRISLAERNINADLRVSTIPTGYGEAVVLRILRQDMKSLSLDQLGFSPYNKDIIEKIIRRPYGLILVTGPTGSGKSTTLYALLSVLNSQEKKIITLEDPIEYKIAGIQQSQIDQERGFDFNEGLKGALRQDPDIVMVGEIRDPETAETALNASLTGHLVLSTLHTNDAVTAATRFMEMGIPPFLLSGSIQMIIAQRLVRKLKPGSSKDNPEFEDRLVIAEVLCPTPEFEQAVINHSDQNTLNEIAKKGGMIPMYTDGMQKVSAGLTVESEITRVTEA